MPNIPNIPDEFMHGAIKKTTPRDPRNFMYAMHSTAKATSREKLPKKASIKAKFPKVYRQNGNSCTANAVVACDDYYYHGVAKPWIPSASFTWYNQRKYVGSQDSNVGSSVELGLKMVRKYGVCNSTVWPNEKRYDAKPTKKAYENGLKGHEITKYYEVTTILQAKKALASGYPVVGSFAWTTSQYDDDFIMDEPTASEAKRCNAGHAIVLVGYDDNKELFEFRNSWGESWGNKGYAYMTYDHVKRCGWWDDIYAVIK